MNEIEFCEKCYREISVTQHDVYEGLCHKCFDIYGGNYSDGDVVDDKYCYEGV